uniref:Uncharacterized protein n=1 Tax=Rhizophagus irregularis (strain DAOM 181602 / DAOM 197198 / MUCL 43194) TaxID=747089 RepID=U9U0P1_RHIID
MPAFGSIYGFHRCLQDQDQGLRQEKWLRENEWNPESVSDVSEVSDLGVKIKTFSGRVVLA